MTDSSVVILLALILVHGNLPTAKSARMKLALFGGSYDPVHLGHLLLADAVHRHAGYDRVLFVPTFVSPFKEKEGSARAHDRVRMLH